MIVPLAFAFTSLVEGETCPAPEDVEQRVRAILQLPVERELTESFLVQRREAGLFVELRAADESVIGQRTLPKDGSCDELAQAAAVVLSAWLNDAHPDFAGALPEPAAEAPREPEPVTATPPRSPPAPPERRVPPPQLALRPPFPPYRWELELGVGVDFSGKKLAVAGSLRTGFVPRRSGLGVTLTALLDAPRREALGVDGHVSWRRWPLALAPTARLTRGSWDLDASLGPALAWLRFAGEGFEPDRRPEGVTWAGFADLRVSSRGKLGAWAGLSALTYFADSTAYVGSGSARAQFPLPRLTLAAWLGGRFAP